MLAYATIGVSDMEQAKKFYDELLGEIGGKIVMDMGRLAAYGTEKGGALFAICVPFDEKAPNPGNGNMVSIAPGSKELVNQLHAKAIELGATDDGEPGQRNDFFYGAYFRDPDGNKICFCQMG